MNDKELNTFLKQSRSSTPTQFASKIKLRNKELIKSFKQRRFSVKQRRFSEG